MRPVADFLEVRRHRGLVGFTRSTYELQFWWPSKKPRRAEHAVQARRYILRYSAPQSMELWYLRRLALGGGATTHLYPIYHNLSAHP